MTDEYNHHVLAKTASDKVLELWRNSEWSNEVVSEQVITIQNRSSFPSPDATFFDEKKNRIITFEFKPPTETKRGMLTAIGQAVAYTDQSSMAYIFCPEIVDSFNISNYFEKLFLEKIKGKLPIGLIKYENDDANKLEILVEIDESTIDSKKTFDSIKTNSERYWAKYQDLPFQLLYYILDTAYIIESSKNKGDAIWEEVWNKYILQNGLLIETLEQVEPNIFYRPGKPFLPGSKKKNELKRKISSTYSKKDALNDLKLHLHPTERRANGESLSQSQKRYVYKFIDHCKLWDDNHSLTESGLRLHMKGKLYGHNSKVFLDNLKKEVLFAGKHLDLIMDLHTFSFCKDFDNKKDLINSFIENYNELGKIKWNKSRGEGGFTTQFKNEMLLWQYCGFLSKVKSKESFIRNTGMDFDWKEITRICTF